VGDGKFSVFARLRLFNNRSLLFKMPLDVRFKSLPLAPVTEPAAGDFLQSLQLLHFFGQIPQGLVQLDISVDTFDFSRGHAPEISGVTFFFLGFRFSLYFLAQC
jgi:hypothetical protein